MRRYKLICAVLVLGLILLPVSAEARYLRYEDGTRALTGLKGQPVETSRSFEREIGLAHQSFDLAGQEEQIRAFIAKIDLNALGITAQDLDFITHADGRIDRIRDTSTGRDILKAEYATSNPQQVKYIKDLVNMAGMRYLTDDDFENGVYTYMEAGYERTIPASALGKVIGVKMLTSSGELFVTLPGSGQEGLRNRGAPISYEMPTMNRSAGLGNEGFEAILAAVGERARSSVTAANTGHFFYGQVHSGGAQPTGFVNFDAFRGRQRDIPQVTYVYDDTGAAKRIYWSFSSSTHNWDAGEAFLYPNRMEEISPGGVVQSSTYYNDPVPYGACPAVTGTIAKDYQGNYFLMGRGDALDEQNSVVADVTGVPFLLAAVKAGDDAIEGSYHAYGGQTDRFTTDALERNLGKEVTMTGDWAAYAFKAIKERDDYAEEDYRMAPGRGGTATYGGAGDAQYQRFFGSGVKYQGQEAYTFYINQPHGWL